MNQVICHGGCRVLGYHTSRILETAWPTLLGQLLGADWHVQERGLGAATIRELDKHAETWVDPFVTPEHSLNIVLLDEITNTIGAHEQGGIVAETLTDLRDYCMHRMEAAKAKGAKLRIGVMLCPAGGQGLREVFRQELNSTLQWAGEEAICADLLWWDRDVTAHGAAFDRELYADMWHPNDAGHIRIAEAALAAVHTMEGAA